MILHPIFGNATTVIDGVRYAFPFPNLCGVVLDFQGHLDKKSKMPASDWDTDKGGNAFGIIDGWFQAEDPSSFMGAKVASITNWKTKQKFYYVHMDELERPGREIKAGEYIGKTGNTGFVLMGDGKGGWRQPTAKERAAGWGSHTHFCRRVGIGQNGTGGKYVDPDPLLNKIWLRLSVAKAKKIKPVVTTPIKVEETELPTLPTTQAPSYATQLDFSQLAEVAGALVVEEAEKRGFKEWLHDAIDRNFKNDSVRAFLKYNLLWMVFVLLGVILNIIVVLQAQITNAEVLTALNMTYALISNVLHYNLTHVDKNKDGKVDTSDLTIPTDIGLDLV